jgi:FkbM family methyltransferase
VKSLLRDSVNILPYNIRHWIKGVPGVAASQRWLLRRFLEGEPFLHTVNGGPAAGLKFEISLPHDKAVWTGTYEHEFASAIVDHIRPGDICYDVGGYRGFMSGAMALAAASQVFVFEPHPTNQQALNRLCELNPALPVRVIGVALGNNDGTGRLKIMPQFSMAKLTASSFQEQATFVKEIDVRICRIDTMVQANEIPVPDLLKIDVEGAELEVLMGAEQVLRKRKPYVFLEAHSSVLEQSCRDALSAFGYALRRLGAEPANAEQTRHLVAGPINAS